MQFFTYCNKYFDIYGKPKKNDMKIEFRTNKYIKIFIL